MTIDKKDTVRPQGNQQARFAENRRGYCRNSGRSVGDWRRGSRFRTLLRQEVQFDAEVKSCCQFCQVRCTTLVQVKNGRVVNVYGNPDNYWTEGGMCPKGQSMVELTYSPHRLLYPLKREGSGWKRISYPEAVDLVAEKILKVKGGVS